jgi:hypothetical protein
MKLREVDCEDWMKLAQALELTTLNFRTALPGYYLGGYLKYNRLKNNTYNIHRLL